MSGVEPTIAAVLTPPGRGALASIGIVGPRAWQVIQPAFRTRKGSLLSEIPEPRTQRLGYFGREVADEVVLAVRQIEPQPWLEIHCHGGQAAVGLILELLEANDCRLVSWDVFLAHTAASSLRGEAAIALAHAATERTANILLDQYHGALELEIVAIVGKLHRGELAEADTMLGDLLAKSNVGLHLTAPFRVTIAGPPNVGKSSLVNALAGFQRSIVAATPGTTRDVVTTRLAIDGWLVEIADTAGQRSTMDSLESAGIVRAQDAAAAADICLWVLDGSATPVWPIGANKNVRFVLNKIDLPSAWDCDSAIESVSVSALQSVGIAELCAALSRWLVPNVPAAGTAVPYTEPQVTALEEAYGHLCAGEATAASDALTGLVRRSLTSPSGHTQ